MARNSGGASTRKARGLPREQPGEGSKNGKKRLISEKIFMNIFILVNIISVILVLFQHTADIIH